MKKTVLFASCVSAIISFVSIPSIVYGETAYSESSNCITNEGNTSVVEDLLDMKFQLSGFSDFQNLSMNQRINQNSELDTYIYCYSKNPAYTPKSVFISTSKVRKTEFEYSESFSEYSLSLVSKTEDGCLTKYSIEGLNNLFEEDRRYNVSMVHYQKESGEIKGVGFGMEFYFHTNEKSVIEGTFAVREVVTITSGIIKDCFFAGGETKYKGNLASVSTYEDSFYYFFNTDWKIDELVEVDVQYYSFDIFIPAFYKGSKFGYAYSYKEYMNDANKYINDWWANFYSYSLTANHAFLEDFPFMRESFSTDNFNQLKKYVSSSLKKQTKTVTPGEGRTDYNSTGWNWFLPYTVRKYANLNNIVDLRNYTFKEGDAFNFTDMKKQYEFGILFEQATRSYYEGDVSWHEPSTWGKRPFGMLVGKGVEQTCITRLKFYKDGKLYDLGTVDIPRETDDDPIPGEPGITIEDPNWWEIVFAIILGVTGLYLIYKFISWLTSSTSSKRRKKHA